jgi:hypothetical protein
MLGVNISIRSRYMTLLHIQIIDVKQVQYARLRKSYLAADCDPHPHSISHQSSPLPVFPAI